MNKTLVILDQISDAIAAENLINVLAKVPVIFTARTRLPSRLSILPLDLTGFKEEESIIYLSSRLTENKDHVDALKAIATRLAGYPYALYHAVQDMELLKFTPEEYDAELRSRGISLVGQGENALYSYLESYIDQIARRHGVHLFGRSFSALGIFVEGSLTSEAFETVTDNKYGINNLKSMVQHGLVTALGSRRFKIRDSMMKEVALKSLMRDKKRYEVLATKYVSYYGWVARERQESLTPDDVLQIDEAFKLSKTLTIYKEGVQLAHGLTDWYEQNGPLGKAIETSLDGARLAEKGNDKREQAILLRRAAEVLLGTERKIKLLI